MVTSRQSMLPLERRWMLLGPNVSLTSFSPVSRVYGMETVSVSCSAAADVLMWSSHAAGRSEVQHLNSEFEFCLTRLIIPPSHQHRRRSAYEYCHFPDDAGL